MWCSCGAILGAYPLNRREPRPPKWLRSFLYLRKGARARAQRRAVEPQMCGALVFVVRIFFCVLCSCAGLSAFFFSMCVSSSALPAFCVGLHSRRIPSNVALECATLRECCLGEGICAQGADGRKSNEKASERMDGDKRTPNSIQY